LLAVGCERPGGRALIRVSLTLGIGSLRRSVRRPPRGGGPGTGAPGPERGTTGT